ncbi:AEC family transporter [Paenibacillus sp.]|uniref:AEC family transporter n=1 Tax=Paenibacillus sp. TaxID=58172 RepID=UPI002D25EE17|nr:AEC family transporter [Paenibacillus sp.]HZG85924.1 AEC family transporter [Paenibacillus sp.]
MDYETLISLMFVVASIIGIGIGLAKRIPFEGEVRHFLGTVIVNVALPCIVLYSIFQLPIDRALLPQIGIVFGLSVGLNAFGMLLGWAVGRCTGAGSKRSRELAILSGLGNSGFLGIPLTASLLGPKGALMAAVFDAGVGVAIWSVAVLLLQDRRVSFRSTVKSLVNIPLLAIAIGILFVVSNAKPPAVVIQLTQMLSALTGPLALFYIGMLIRTIAGKQEKVKPAELIAPIVIKLAIFPLVSLLVLAYLELDPTTAQAVLLQTAMPTLTLSTILFARYRANEGLATWTAAASTLLSLITMPCVMLLGHRFLM